MGNCIICEHEKRIDIESALLAGQTARNVAKFYNVDVAAIESHSSICSTYVLGLEEFDNIVMKEIYEFNESQGLSNAAVKLPGSIQRQIGLREGDMLAAVMQEHLVTLKNMGRQINHYINKANTREGLTDQQKFLRKPIMDAYVLVSSEMRQTAKTMADIEKMLHAPEPESPVSGLYALTNAIAISKKNVG